MTTIYRFEIRRCPWCRRPRPFLLADEHRKCAVCGLWRPAADLSPVLTPTIAVAGKAGV